MPRHSILVVSDAHFFNPQFYANVADGHTALNPPSRLSTELALGDRKANPFHALVELARSGSLTVETLVCCGDLTTCADPTAMNLGWLQLHRLANELGVEAPIITAGNHDIDSRFQISSTNPQRMLRYLDPRFPTSDASAEASYWSNGYCVIDRGDARFVLANTCSLHGYATEADRQLDHGSIPEELISRLPQDLADREERSLNFFVCHHHPVEIDVPAEDQSVIDNGTILVAMLEDLSPPPWVVIHGHRHLPGLRYATASPASPVIFSAGSLAANLHMRLQGRTANQFYLLEVEHADGLTLGRYRAWTWDQHEGEWLEGQDTRALSSTGGFGYRPDVVAAAATIAPLVPDHAQGAITWGEVEAALPKIRFVIEEEKRMIVEALSSHGVQWETDNGRLELASGRLRLGRTA